MCSVCLHSKSCSPAGKNERLRPRDSPVWSPHLNRSSTTSVWTRIWNMQPKNTTRKTWLQSLKKGRLLTVMTSLTSNHPCLSPLTFLSVLQNGICDLPFSKLCSEMWRSELLSGLFSHRHSPLTLFISMRRSVKGAELQAAGCGSIQILVCQHKVYKN